MPVSKTAEIAARLIGFNNLFNTKIGEHTWCGRKNPDTGFYCTRESGHNGFHVAQYGPNNPCPDPVWED